MIVDSGWISSSNLQINMSFVNEIIPWVDFHEINDGTERIREEDSLNQNWGLWSSIKQNIWQGEINWDLSNSLNFYFLSKTNNWDMIHSFQKILTIFNMNLVSRQKWKLQFGTIESVIKCCSMYYHVNLSCDFVIKN